MDVDSHEIVHTAQVIQGTTPDGKLATSSIIYQNNLFETRRSNGFSDPVVLKTVVQDNNAPLSDDKGSILSLDLVVTADDTVHVVWMQTVPRPTSIGDPALDQTFAPRLFYCSRSAGVWSSISQLTPDIDPTSFPEITALPPPPGAYNTPYVFGPSHLPRIPVTLSYGNLLVRRGADGKAYFLVQASGYYSYTSSRPAAAGGIELITEYSTYSYLAFAPLGSPSQIIPCTVTKVGLLTGFGEIDPIDVLNIEAPISQELYFDFAVSPAGEPLFIWYCRETDAVNFGNNLSAWYATGADLRNRAALPAQADLPFGANDYLLAINVYFDPQGNSHLYWGNAGKYRLGPTGTTQTIPGAFGGGTIHIDDRGQHHLITGAPFAGTTIQVVSRLVDPQSHVLSDSFVPTGSMYGPLTLTQNVGSVDDTNQGGVILAQSGRLYLYSSDSVTRSRASILGVRDAVAMVGGFPGGQINVTNGNLHSRINLFSTRGVGPAQSLDLVYNSQESAGGAVGSGWKLSTEIYLVDDWQYTSNIDLITLVEADGREVQFTGTGLSGVYFSGALGQYSRIERQSSTSLTPEYKLTTKTGDALWFNSDGRLRQVQDPAGNTMDLVYDSGHLIQLRDTNGARSSYFTYEGSNPVYGSRLTQVTDPAGATYTLNYGGLSLSSVAFSSGPGAPTYSFDYGTANDPLNGTRLGMLSRFRTPRGTAGNYGWTCLYHQNGLVSQIQDPAEAFLAEGAADGTVPSVQAAIESFRYSDQGSTWVTDRRGFRTVYSGDSSSSLVSQVVDEAVLAQMPGIFPIVRIFDGLDNLIDVQDRWGFHTSYTFDYTNSTPPFIYDNLLSVLRPSAVGAGQDLVVTYTYTADGLNRVRTQTTYATPAEGGAPVARTTTNDYNSAGQVVAIHYPDVSYPDGTIQSGVQSTFEYNGPQSQLTRAVNENGHGTTFSNFDGLTGLPGSVLADGGSDPRQFSYDAMGNLLQKREPRGGAMNEPPGWTQLNRDGLYRVSTQVDPKGRITSFSYDVDSNLVQATPPAGSSTVTAFDRRGFASGGSTPDGTWSQFVDAAGNVRRSIDLRGFASNRDLDFMGRVVEVRTPGASTDSSGMGGGGQAVEVSDFTYDGVDTSGRFSTAVQKGSPGDRTTRTLFDNRGRASLVVAPDGATATQTFYDELDHVIASQSTFGSQVQQCVVTFRDSRDRSYQVRRQNGPFGGTSSQQSSTYTIFDPAGNVARMVDELGRVDVPGYAHKRTFLYDVRERLQYEIDGKGVLVRENVYGDDDRLVEVKVPDPEGKTLQLVTQATFSYTTRKETLATFDRNGNGVTNLYGDLPGQLLTATDALGQVTQNQYDPSTVRVNQVIEAVGSASENRTMYGWTNGLLTQTQVWNPATQAYDATHTRTYDQAGRLEKVQAPMVAPEQFFYNAFSEMNQTIAGTKTLAVQMNALGQAVQKTWSGAFSAQQTLGYDGAGNLRSIDDGNLARSMSYETWKGAPLDEAFSVGGAIWKIQSHNVDNAGNYVGLSDAEAKIHEWPVDENNQPTQKRYDNQTVATLSYTPGGLLDKEVLQNASGAPIATTTQTYDSVGRPAASQTVDTNGQVLSEYAWDYNARHDVVAIHVNHLNAHFTIGVDGRGRVNSVSTPGNQGGLAPPPPYTNQIGDPSAGVESTPSSEIPVTPKGTLAVPARTASYVFGPGGERQSQTVDGVTTTYAYNSANQLVSESAPNRTVDHTYDEWGNESTRTTSLVVRTPSGTTTQTTTETYGYNHLNLLSTYTNSQTGAAWQYDYYPSGERYGKTDLNANAGEVYVPRFGEVVGEYARTASTSNVTITPKNTYVGGLGLNSKNLRIGADGTRRHLIGDRVGTVGMTLDENGAPADTTVKDPWGVSIAGSTAEPYGGVAQSKLDSESGLTFMRNRMYDPALGRFTQTDPILGRRATAHYTYGSNNPVGRVDPLGLTDEEALARFKRNIPVALSGNEYAKRLYAMFESHGWHLDAEAFWWDNYEPAYSKKVLTLDTKNESKAINKFIEWMEGQFGQAVAEEMFNEQLSNGQGQVESATALRSQLWHETQLYAKKATASMVREGIAAATGPYGSAVNGLAHAAEGNYEAAVWNAVPLAIHGVAGAAELKPYGGSGGGHHPVAKSAFTGAANYDAKAALAIPNAELTRLGVNHATVTGAQMTGYTAFAKTGATLTWESMQEIEVQALIKGGMKSDMAKSTVQTAIQALKDAGVAGPTRIPWGN
jgi:RHS repeat-associated protein